MTTWQSCQSSKQTTGTMLIADGLVECSCRSSTFAVLAPLWPIMVAWQLTVLVFWEIAIGAFPLQDSKKSGHVIYGPM